MTRTPVDFPASLRVLRRAVAGKELVQHCAEFLGRHFAAHHTGSSHKSIEPRGGMPVDVAGTKLRFLSAVRVGVGLTLLVAGLLLFQSPLLAQPAPLHLVTPPSQRVRLGQSFQLQLSVNGGVAPYHWRFSGQQVPSQLSIDANTGLVSGTMKAAGEFKIPVTVTDSSSPAQEATATLVISGVPTLEVRWRQKARVANGGISGAVAVENNSGNTLQMTVIVLAVNTIGKAFALGYQHFDLNNAAKSPAIPFGSSLPYDSYRVYVDAVGEDAADNRIYRSRLQTEGLTLQQPKAVPLAGLAEGEVNGRKNGQGRGCLAVQTRWTGTLAGRNSGQQQRL